MPNKTKIVKKNSKKNSKKIVKKKNMNEKCSKKCFHICMFRIKQKQQTVLETNGLMEYVNLI